MSVDPNSGGMQAQINELLRGQLRLEGDMKDAFRQLNARMDTHDRRHDQEATVSRQRFEDMRQRADTRHENLINEFHEHTEEDGVRFAELQSTIKNRSAIGTGFGLIISALMAALGVKVGGGS